MAEVWKHGVVVAELQEADDGVAVSDSSHVLGGFELGEEVTGEQRLLIPNFTARGRALELEAGAIHFDLAVLGEPGSGDVLRFGARLHGIPQALFTPVAFDM